MKIRFEQEFIDSLTSKIKFIAKDNPSASRRFKNEILKKCEEIADMPYKHRKSIYHEDDTIRDLIYKGYTIIYIILKDEIIILMIINHDKYNPKD